MKKRVKSLFLAALSAVLALSILPGCTAKTDDKPPEGPSQSTPANPDLGIRYAERFKIEYLADDVKVVTDSQDRTFLLVPKGQAIPAGRESLPVIRTPIERVFYCSTTHVGLLGALGDDTLYDSIVALSTEESRWTTPQIIERFKSGQITYIPTDNWGVADVETLVTLDPDAIFMVANPDLGRLTQYEDVGLTYLAVGEWLEKTNPASMEWIKFFAAFYNLDDLANTVFDAKLARMAELATMAESIPDADRPLVAYCMVWDGTVYTQSSDSTTAKEVYRAGGIYYLTDMTSEGSVVIGMEEFFDRARDADIIIYSGLQIYTPDKAALLEIDPLFAEMKAFKNDQVYVYASDYYMRNSAKDQVFEDMVAIFNPQLLPDHQQSLIIKLPD